MMPDDNPWLRTPLVAAGPNLYTFGGGHEPTSGVVVGDDCCLVVDAQPSPLAAAVLLQRLREVTPKPVRYVVLTHHHAERTLGLSAFPDAQAVVLEAQRRLFLERGAEDAASAAQRFPALFRGADPNAPPRQDVVFSERLTLFLGRRRVDLFSPGRGHTAGDVVAWVPDCDALFAGDLVADAIALDGGDGFLRAWPETLETIEGLGPRVVVPGRGPALTNNQQVKAAFQGTHDFVDALFGAAQLAAARGMSAAEACATARRVMDGPFGRWPLHAEFLPRNVMRAYDEVRGIEWPRVWTPERDRAARRELGLS